MISILGVNLLDLHQAAPLVFGCIRCIALLELLVQQGHLETWVRSKKLHYLTLVALSCIELFVTFS